MSHLSPDKTTGPHNIGNLNLKNCHHSLCKFMKLFFQAFLNKKYSPTFWKISQGTPISKEENKADVTRYRLISQHCCCSKVSGKLIFDEIFFFWTRFHPGQYGFRKKQSVKLKIRYFNDKKYKYNDLESTKELSVPYLDFAKAFDTVPHDKLRIKLEEQGLGGNVFGIINHFYLGDNIIFKSIRKDPAKKFSPAEYPKVLSVDHYYSSSLPLIYLKR